MPWYLISYTGRAPTGGTVVRADELARDDGSVSLHREGKTVFVAPADWVAAVEEFPNQHEANQQLKELLAERNRYRCAQAVSEEHIVIRPPRAGEVGRSWAGIVESGGVTVKLADVAQLVGAAPAQSGQGRTSSSEQAPPGPGHEEPTPASAPLPDAEPAPSPASGSEPAPPSCPMPDTAAPVEPGEGPG